MKIPSMKPWNRISLLAAATAVMVALAPGARAMENWFPFPVEVWNPPFNMESPRRTVEYVPLPAAAQPWDICVSFPHLKDSYVSAYEAYWLAVNYGVVAESERLGVRMQLVEAGGFTNLDRQISQIKDCVARGADAVVIGATSYDGMNNLVSEVRGKGIPVIDLVNDISSPELSAKSLISFGDMGFKTGQYIAKAHPKGSGKVKVAWFPGPRGASWVEAGNQGFQEAVAGSDIEVVETKYGDTSTEVQTRLVEDTLDAHPDIQYIVGNSPTTEAAVSLLRARGLADKIKVLAYYFTPGVFRGIQRGQILAAATDSAVIQGRVAIDQAVRILEGKPYEKHVGPVLYVIDSENVATFDRDFSLAPEGFKPTFTVD